MRPELRLALSLACYLVSLACWLRGFLLLSRLAAHRARPLAAGEKIRVWRADPGEFTPEGDRVRRQGLLAFGVAIVALLVAIWL